MSSSSFWSQVRWRLGGHMSSANRINDLVQKQIDANADIQDVTTEEILAPIVTLPSKMTMADHLFKAKVRELTTGSDCLFPVDPDLLNLRLWIKNFHGGRYIQDWSFMGNTIQLNGTNQPQLVHSTDDDGVSGGLPVNSMVEDQYIRTLDNPNVRIKEISATATGISIFARIYVRFNENVANSGMPGVLFSKIDTEQVDYAYAAYVPDDGSIQFYVRNGGREYLCTAPAGTVVWTPIGSPDFLQSDFLEGDFFTVQSAAVLPPIPDPIPYDDFCFTFQFSNGRMQIIKNGTIVTDTNNRPEATNLVGWWRLNEGGDIGDTADNPSSYSRTVFNSVPTANNGLVANATWASLPGDPAGNLYLLFDDVGSDSVTISNYTGIDVLSTFTVSLWYFVRTNPTTGEEDNLIKKNWNNNSSFSVLANNPSGTVQLVFSIKDSVGTLRTTTKTTPFSTLNAWYHIVARWGGTGTQPSLTVNGVKTIGASLTGTVSTGATNLIIGDTGTSTPDGYIHDVKFWNRTLSDTETTTVFNAGHPVSAFPAWKANPPTGPPPPSPTTNPFVSVYLAPTPAAAEQDVTRLHKITASSLTERYNVGQGSQDPGTPITENAKYSNDPTYDSGTAVQETLSTGYNALNATLTGYAITDNVGFNGERVETGLDVIGKKITKVVCKLADINPTAAPATGSVVCKIKRNSDNATMATSQNVDASTLINNGPTVNTTSWDLITFTFTGNTYAMVNDDRIQVEYDQGGTGGETASGYMNRTVTGGGAAIMNSSGSFTGQVVDNTSAALHNKVISRIVVKLAKYSGTPTGNCQAQLIRGTTSAVLASSNTVSATNITGTYSGGTWTDITFTFAGNSTPMDGNTDDYIKFIYSGSGELVSSFSANNQANSRGFAYQPGFGFDFGAGLDCSMDVYIGGGAAKQIGLALTNVGVANAVKFNGPWSSPTTITENAASDVCMDIYFDAATGQPNHQYTQLRLDANKFVAEYVNSTSAEIYGQKLTKITARIYKVGSPTGTLFCRIKKGAGGTDITFNYTGPGTPGTGLTVSGLGTASNPATLHTFENDANGDEETGYALTTGDRIIFELSGGSSTSSNYVQVARTTTASTVPNVHLQTSTAGSTWTTSSNDDVIGSMYIGGFTTPVVNPYYTLGYVYDRVLQKVTETNNVQGNIYNQKITQVKVWLKRVGSPTGTLTVGIRNAAGTLVSPINTQDVTGVSDIDFTQYTFTNLSQSYTLAVGDRISVEYSGGNSSNHIQVNANLLNTYPYGNLELFSGSTYTNKAIYDLAGIMYSGGGATDPLARTRMAERCVTASSAINLKKISRIKVLMKRTGSPPANVIFRIRNAADTIVQELGTKSAITIDPNTLTEYTITSSPIAVYALQVGDRVCIEYNDGDDFNFVDVMTSKTTDIFDGTTNTYLEKYTDISWVSNNAIDLVGQMWEGGDTYTPSQEDVTIPPPVYTKDLTTLAGGYPWTYVDHSAIQLTTPQSQRFINAVMNDFRFYRKILTTTELTNLFTNRVDIGAILYGKVAITGYFAISET